VLRSTKEELARSPVGRFVCGETFLHFCAAPDLWGFILWGRPEERHAIELGRTLLLELGPPAEPHAAIIDASRLEGGDPAAFGAAERYVSRHASSLATWVTRLALVRPAGMMGAVVAGAHEVLPRPYPVQIFDDAASAFEWLSPAHRLDGPALLRELYGEATGISPLLGSLRGWLDGHLGGVGIAEAARALGVSERTLQRKLRGAETTFKEELTHARIRAAKQKLLESDAPLTVIALDVGCTSLQHFSSMFRRHTRESPSAFRARARSSK
jgi:AraC-like DNA-binding protein